MNEPRNPSEIAREALTTLAAKRLAPTPANYQACYNEIAKLPNVAPFPEFQLRQLAALLTGKNETQEKELNSLDSAIAQHK